MRGQYRVHTLVNIRTLTLSSQNGVGSIMVKRLRTVTLLSLKLTTNGIRQLVLNIRLIGRNTGRVVNEQILARHVNLER